MKMKLSRKTNAAPDDASRDAPRKNVWFRKQALPLATLSLVAFNVAVHFLITGGTFWIAPDVNVLSSFGLNQKLPIPSLLTYSSLHLWPSHLVVDMLLLLAFGTLVERKSGWRTTLLVFFAAAIVGGMVHISTSNAVLVGSSIGVFGLVGAAIILHPVFSVIGLLVLPTLTFHASQRIDSIETTERLKLEKSHLDLMANLSNVTLEIDSVVEKNATLKNASETLLSVLDEYETRLSEAEELLETGNISHETYENISTELIRNKTQTETKLLEVHAEIIQVETKAEELSEKSKTLYTELETVGGAVKQFENTQKLREEAPSATLMHIVGMFTGYGCILLLCPEALNHWSEQVGRLVNGLINHGRKKKKKQAVPPKLK